MPAAAVDGRSHDQQQHAPRVYQVEESGRQQAGCFGQHVPQLTTIQLHDHEAVPREIEGDEDRQGGEIGGEKLHDCAMHPAVLLPVVREDTCRAVR